MKQIYISVYTSSLTLLLNKVAVKVKPNQTEQECCAFLCDRVATDNKIDISNLLVQYYNNFEDCLPETYLFIPKPIEYYLSLKWYSKLSKKDRLELIQKYLPNRPHIGDEYMEQFEKESLFKEYTKHIDKSDLISAYISQ
jgi:hypothetical protein